MTEETLQSLEALSTVNWSGHYCFSRGDLQMLQNVCLKDMDVVFLGLVVNR